MHFLERLCHLDAAALAAAAGMDLGLHHPDLAADFARSGIRLGHRKASDPARGGNSVPTENFLALILVNVHGLAWAICARFSSRVFARSFVSANTVSM